MSTCISREGEYSSHGDLVDDRCVRCGDEVDVELNTDYEGPDDEEKLLTMASGTAKMRITGRMTRIASLTAELTKLYQEQHEDMRVLKAKADAYDKMVRLLRSVP